MSGSIVLGRVRPKYKGEYNPDIAYGVLERVKYKGQIYECVAKTTAGIAPDSAEHGSAYWTQISVNNPIPQAVWDGTALSFEYPDGEVTTPVDLQGPQGIQGEPGEVNITSDLTSTATDVALSALAGKNLKAMIDNIGMGGVTLYDGPIDFTDEEQIEEITENKPIGSIVAYDCCPDCSTAEDVVVGGAWNTEIWITESCDWKAPVTGWYEVLAIDGGIGSRIIGGTYLYSGRSGLYKFTFAHFVKGDIIPITIGTAGISQIVNSTAELPSSWIGGITTVGNLYFPVSTILDFSSPFVFSNSPVYVHGGGFGGAHATENASFYGGGGGGQITANTTEGKKVTQPKQGAVRLRYYDASKDKNISIDMASSITIKELQAQVAALTARVQELENE